MNSKNPCRPDRSTLAACSAGSPLVKRMSRCRSVRRSEEHTSELQSQSNLVCRLLLEKKKSAVDDNTSTHGYAVVQRASLHQVFMSPTSDVRDAIYHLLGCCENFNMSCCYGTVTALKR